jgi:hypothetical protein
VLVGVVGWNEFFRLAGWSRAFDLGDVCEPRFYLENGFPKNRVVAH